MRRRQACGESALSEIPALPMMGKFYRSFSTEFINATDSSNDNAAA